MKKLFFIIVVILFTQFTAVTQVNFLMLSVGTEYKAVGDINWAALYLNVSL